MENYCRNCKFQLSEKITNGDGFCSLGYKQNPRSEQATKNALAHGAIICRFNPWKHELNRPTRKKGHTDGS